LSYNFMAVTFDSWVCQYTRLDPARSA
jgi:hypothetical protein